MFTSWIINVKHIKLVEKSIIGHTSQDLNNDNHDLLKLNKHGLL